MTDRLCREAVEFVVKGPVPVAGDDEVNLNGVQALDLCLARPSTIGELVFRNYYTATVAVLVFYQGKGDVGAGKQRRGSWSCSVAQKILMPNPHLEPGSHDTFSITPSDSVVPWTDVIMMRLILRQPSPLWLTFKIEEVNLFSDLPRMSGGLETDSERHLLSLMRQQTLAALNWRPPSPSACPSPAYHISSGYEIHKLSTN